MSKREILLKEIIDQFALLDLRIKSNNKLGMTDINIVSEYFSRNLLNVVYGYSLNTVKNVNCKSIDLEDYDNRVAFQITSQKRKAKIQKTLDGLQSDYITSHFDEIFIFILGNKQKTYKGLIVPENFKFDSKNQIIDFDDVIMRLRSSPLKRLIEVNNLFINEFTKNVKPEMPKSQAQVKRELKQKRKIELQLLRQLDYDERDIAFYEPVVKFTYRDIIIRSALDFAFPESDEVSKIGSSTWFKTGIYDFYSNGIEFQLYGGQRIIFDDNDNWDTVEFDEYNRKEKYSCKSYCAYMRIPYSQIIELDMSIDPYYGLPTLLVNYNSNHEPFEDIVYGLPGSYEEKKNRVLLSKNKKVKLY